MHTCSPHTHIWLVSQLDGTICHDEKLLEIAAFCLPLRWDEWWTRRMAGFLNNLLGHELWLCSIENYKMGLPQAKRAVYRGGK